MQWRVGRTNTCCGRLSAATRVAVAAGSIVQTDGRGGVAGLSSILLNSGRKDPPADIFVAYSVLTNASHARYPDSAPPLVIGQ